MHGHRQEEDRVTVVGPRSSAEVFLHGFNNWKQLFRQLIHIMHYYLGETPETPLSHCLWGRAQHRLPLLSQQRVWGEAGVVKAQILLVGTTAAQSDPAAPDPVCPPVTRASQTWQGKEGRIFTAIS